MFLQVLLALIKGETPDLTGLVAAFKGTLCDTSLDNAFKALALSLPTESYLADLLPEGEADPDVIHEKRELLVRSICEACAVDMWAVYEANKDAVRGETSGEVCAPGHKEHDASEPHTHFPLWTFPLSLSCCSNTMRVLSPTAHSWHKYKTFTTDAPPPFRARIP